MPPIGDDEGDWQGQRTIPSRTKIFHMIYGKNNTPSTFDQIAGIYRTAESPEEKIAALRDMGSSDREQAIPFLIGALRDDNKEVRKAATEILGSAGESAIAPLAALLRDEWWVVRYRACEALGMIKNPLAYPHIRSAISDEKDHVRYMAAKGIGTLGIPAAALDLEPLLEDENPYVRRMAANAVVRIKG
ncbi:HEAT repeat domain-containing protein [Methanocalculus taiwanensis]|nr:HEAT repeat domain-containing protein [Methanocalculus taiwanensis]